MTCERPGAQFAQILKGKLRDRPASQVHAFVLLRHHFKNRPSQEGEGDTFSLSLFFFVFVFLYYYSSYIYCISLSEPIKARTFIVFSFFIISPLLKTDIGNLNRFLAREIIIFFHIICFF